jgi:circadian clock protein KaiC
MILEAKIASLNNEFESVEEELNRIYMEEELKKQITEQNRKELARIRLNSSKDEGNEKNE